MTKTTVNDNIIGQARKAFKAYPGVTDVAYINVYSDGEPTQQETVDDAAEMSREDGYLYTILVTKEGVSILIDLTAHGEELADIDQCEYMAERNFEASVASLETSGRV